MEFKTIPGFRKNSQLLLLVEKNELYVKNRETAKKTYYVCYEKGCQVRLCIEEGRCFYMKEAALHSHGDLKNLVAELTFRNSVKDKCSQSSVRLNTPATVGNERSVYNAELLRYFWIYHNLEKFKIVHMIQVFFFYRNIKQSGCRCVFPPDGEVTAAY